MPQIIIPVEFFKALDEQPAIFKLMWVNWLSNYDLLNNPLFCEKLKYKDVPFDKIKECYAFGMQFFKEGFILKEKTKRAKPKSATDAVKDIIQYLNQVAGTSYRHDTKQTIEYISGRLSDGFTKDDFYKVIDKKVDEWKGTEQEVYLRPITLFSPSKFEIYLNQPSKQNGRKQQDSSFAKAGNAIAEAQSRLRNEVR